MKIFGKLKDILFDDVEEEETTPVKREEVVRKVETPRVEEPVKVVKEEIKEEKTPEQDFNNINERNLFKSENTFTFPDFDEEEFSSSIERNERPKTTNVLEYEKKRRVEKKYDFGRYERVETKEVVEKKKFTPSPIISPVYGILNEDYKIEDIKDVTLENAKANNAVNIEAVRKKAFETPIDMKKPDEKYYEETVSVRLKDEPIQMPIEEKSRTIDELLADAADEEISVYNNRHEREVEPVVEPEPVNVEPEEAPSAYDEIDNELDDLKTSKEDNTKNEEYENDETLENDLFDLIDSMYENGEDGEE